MADGNIKVDFLLKPHTVALLARRVEELLAVVADLRDQLEILTWERDALARTRSHLEAELSRMKLPNV